MKIDQESDLTTEQPEMRQQLRFIDRMDQIFAFEFDYDSVVHHEICPKSAVQFGPLVDKRYCFLTNDVQTVTAEFVRKASLIGRLQ